MIAAQHKSNQSNSIPSPIASPDPSQNLNSPNANQVLPINYTVHTKYVNQIETNGDETYATDDYYDEESMHAIDLSTTAATAPAPSTPPPPPPPQQIIDGATNSGQAAGQHPPINNNGNSVVAVVVDDNSTNESVQISSQYSQYIAKNPNLTFKGDNGDIMNMDIIFENVSIEEDTSITSTASVPIPPATSNVRVDIDSNNGAETVEHLNIGGVHYQIITINEDNAAVVPAEDNVAAVTEFVQQEGEREEEVASDVSQMSVIIDEYEQVNANDDDNGNNNHIMIDTNMMVMSNLDVAAEEEMAGETDELLPTVPPLSPQNVKSEDETGAVLRPSTARPAEPIQPSENRAASGARKRKPKIIPVLAQSKRMRQNHPNNNADGQRSVQSSSPEKVPPKWDHETSAHFESTAVQANAMNVFQSEQDTEQTFSTFAHAEHDECDRIEDGDDDDDDSECKSHIKHERHQTNADDDMPERSFLDSLVVVESQDPNEPNHTIYEVFVVDPDTNEMSEKPLDLPEHVIQRIRLAMS